MVIAIAYGQPLEKDAAADLEGAESANPQPQFGYGGEKNAPNLMFFQIKRFFDTFLMIYYFFVIH